MRSPYLRGMVAAISTKTKRGRKPRPYVTASGDPIPGLARRKSDGRWRVVATGYTFTEPHEGRAIQRFCELEDQRSNRAALVPLSDAADGEAAGKAMMKARRGAFVARIPLGGGPIKLMQSFDSAAIWAYVTDVILNRPAYAAQRTGIEALGWLPDLRRPQDSLKLVNLIEIYANKPGLSVDEVTRVRRFWREFCKSVNVQTVRELRHENIEDYELATSKLELSPKSVKHRYSAIRTVLAYAMRRGRGADDCRSALDALAMLSVEDVNTLDPRPITPADFWAIHSKAIKAKDKVFAALLLLALNAAMYASEAGSVRWIDVDLKRGEFATRRNKTQVPRVAMLWPETISALATLPRDRETIFNTSRQAYTRKSVYRPWTEYRVAAKISDGVTFGMIRDAAFTIACRKNVDQARILAGHRLPGSVDHYVLRNPGFVADVCDSIHREFFEPRAV